MRFADTPCHNNAHKQKADRLARRFASPGPGSGWRKAPAGLLGCISEAVAGCKTRPGCVCAALRRTNASRLGLPRIRNAATSAPPSYASTRNPPLNPLQQPGLRVLAVAPAFHPVLEPVLAGCPTQPVLAGCGTAAAQPVLAGCGTAAAAKSLFVNPPAASEQQRLRIRFCKTPGGSGTAEILVLRRRRRQPRDGIALAKPYSGGFQVGVCVCVCVVVPGA